MTLVVRHVHGGRVDRLSDDQWREVVAGDGFLWVDLDRPSDEEAAILRDPRLALDPLVIADMREDRHLPKLDVFSDQVFLTVHGIRLETADIEVETVELDVVLGPETLLTYREAALASVDHVADRLERHGPGSIVRPSQLLHVILDVMNDVFVPFADLIDRRLDWIEEDILSDPTEHTRREIYGLQRDVIQLRRALVPQAEVIRRLPRDASGVLDAHDASLFRDVHDHLYRIVELTDSYGQLLDSAMQSYRSALSDRLNGMLAVLTMISAVILPLSLVAGIYGMNFEHMPELGWRFGYLAVWGVFLVIVTGMLTWFRRRGWIGRTRAERERAERRREQVLEIPRLGHVLRVPAYGARVLLSTGRGVLRLPTRVQRLLRRRGRR